MARTPFTREPNMTRYIHSVWAPVRAAVSATALLALLFVAFAANGLETAEPKAAGGAGGWNEVLKQHLRDRSGSACVTEAFIDVMGVDRWFGPADSMTQTSGWLPGTDKSIWVGDVALVNTAVQGELLGEADGVAWFIAEEPSGPVGMRFARFMSDGGRQLWVLVGRIYSIPCD